ncbi:MAG TPA: ATP phosphoribosyltransferase regulatory subunit [Holophagaceae bacterium]|nr:ATP phosphoribosyltransferase regulatory subunit [Holophagaceae bacterium]
MPIRTPHFPDLLFDGAARLRAWEDALMGLLGSHGYAELHPSLVLREPMAADTLRFFDGEELVALRWDFTVSLARLLAGRFPEPPPRVSYAGAVFRRPTQPWEAVERFEVGCERLQIEGEDAVAADLELARLLMAVPGRLGLRGGLLQLGDAAFWRRPLEEEAVPPEAARRATEALHRRSPHRVAEALSGHPAAPRLAAHATALLAELDGARSLDALAASPYAGMLDAEAARLRDLHSTLLPMLPAGLDLRVDPADVAGLDFYTGPTLRLWAPGAQAELAAGGRYDRLYPELGRPWQAAGFCVRLSRLLDLRQTRPELFET